MNRRSSGAKPSSEYLAATYFLDHASPEVRRYASEAVGNASDDRSRAVALFYAVRDGLRYDPYTISGDRADYRASVAAGSERSFCIPKAVLLAAAARAVGIPSRLGFADVRNHLSSGRLSEILGTDLFVFHGYVELWLDGRWVKATPAFNRELCERFGVEPLEFDGAYDALFQPYDGQGRRHMEYVHDRGTWSDFPFEEMIRACTETYGHAVLERFHRATADPAFAV